jgi:hypothetical protein
MSVFDSMSTGSQRCCERWADAYIKTHGGSVQVNWSEMRRRNLRKSHDMDVSEAISAKVMRMIRIDPPWAL